MVIIPYPHLYFILDSGHKTEVPLSKFLKVEADDGEHILKVIFKSKKEYQARFCPPVVGKIALKGYFAKGNGVLPEDNRKTIEFMGDSITEGQLTEADVIVTPEDNQDYYPYQNDVTATYAWLVAEKLNLRNYHVGHGGSGVVKIACAGVPKAIDFYEYSFHGIKVNYPEPDYILFNYGANDQMEKEDVYIEEYEKLLRYVRKIRPNSVIIVLSAFVGVFAKALGELVEKLNKELNDNIYFIDSTGWVPKEPLHPYRDGHKIIAEKLTEKLRGIID